MSSDRAPFVTEATVRGLLLAFGSGAAATVAFALTPFWEPMGPIPFPHPLLEWLDLRLLALPLLFPLLHLIAGALKWPRPALLLPALALLAAGTAHLTGSAVLDLIAQVPGSAPGERIDVFRAFASGASLLLALWAGLDRGHQRLRKTAREAGMPPEALRELRRIADAQASATLAFGGAAFAAFVLVARVGDAVLGTAEAPLPEIVGAVVATGVAVLLFPGLGTRLHARQTES